MGRLTNFRVNAGCAVTLLQKKPIFAAWLITHRCNLKCKFCHFWKRDVDVSKELSVIDFARGSKFLTKMGIRVVNLAGGEPTIRKDLPDIIKVISNDHIVIINTNGTLITHDYAEEIWKAGCDIVNVSLDFPSEEVHNYYRGEGVYKKTLAAIEYFLETKKLKRQKVALQAILCPDNYYNFEELVKIANFYNIDFTFNPYRPGDSEADLSFKDISLDFLYELKKKYKVFKAPNYVLEMTKEYIANGGHYGRCGGGKYMLAIDPYGEIIPCEARIELSAGNIKSIQVDEVLAGLLKINESLECDNCLCRERSEVEPLYHWGDWEWFQNLLEVRK